MIIATSNNMSESLRLATRARVIGSCMRRRVYWRQVDVRRSPHARQPGCRRSGSDPLSAVRRHARLIWCRCQPWPCNLSDEPAQRQGEIDLDPAEQLRRLWDLHVDFGLANPAVYTTDAW